MYINNNNNTCTCIDTSTCTLYMSHTLRSKGSLGDFWSLIFGLGLLKSLIFS